MGRGVKDVDKGYRDLVKRVFATGSPKVEIGILAEDGAAAAKGGSGVTVLDVAIWNEFGTATIPERSFIRAWFDENETKILEATRRMLQAVIAGKYEPTQAIELLSQRFVAEIQKRMAGGIPPPNAASTVKAKGSSTPLIDTGQLRSSISYSVDGKAGKKSG